MLQWLLTVTIIINQGKMEKIASQKVKGLKMYLFGFIQFVQGKSETNA